MSTRRTGGWVLALAGAAAPLAAQDVRDTTALPPIVVTATRVPLPVNQLGARVTIITAAEIAAAGYTTVSAALEGLAGLSVARTSGPGSATSVFLRGGESDYVKVLVDGIPLNEPGGAYDFAHLTTDNIERIEVVRGPASVVHGSDAVAGVVHLLTRTGGARYAGRVRGGTSGALEADAEVAGAEGAAAYAVTGAWRRTDGLYDVNSGYENANLAGRIRIEPASGTSADFTVRMVNATYRYPTDGAGNVVDTNQHQLTRTTTLGLGLAQQLHERVRARLALRSHAIGGGLDDPPDGPGDTIGAYAYRSQRELDRRLADLSAEWLAAPGLTITAGGVYEHQRDRSTDAGRSEFGDYGSATDVRRQNWAAYGEAAATRGPATFTLGGRLDENERFGSFVTWRAGLSARSSFGLRAFGSAGTGFKEPTFFEQLGGGFVVGNPNLSPERSTSWELGLEQTLVPAGVTVSASWFGQRFRDLVQYSYTPVTPGGANYANLAAADADGVEVEATAIPIAGARLTAQYTYLRTEVTDAGALPEDDAAFRQGDRLLRRPTHAAATTLGWEARIVGAHAAVRWTGDRADADFSTVPTTRVELPAYTVVDVGVTVRAFADRGPLAGTAVELQVRNVFDADYQTAYGFPAMGRVVVVGVRVGKDN